MLVKLPPKLSVSVFAGYLKGKSVLMINDRQANLKHNHVNAKGHYVSTVGTNEKTILSVRGRGQLVRPHVEANTWIHLSNIR